MYVYIYVYIYIYIHTYIHIYIYICMYLMYGASTGQVLPSTLSYPEDSDSSNGYRY